MMQNQKLNFRLIVAAVLTVVGCGLLIAGFIVPPLGAIDSSVLVAFGETSTFVGAVLGIDYNYKFQIYKSRIMNGLKENEREIM